VTLIHCSYCGERPGTKLSQLTFAWNNANRERVAFRQRLCAGCFAVNVLALDKPVNPTDSLTCPACGIDTEHDFDAVYATAYVPGFGKISYEWPLCAPCAVETRNRARKNAERLEDRQLGAAAEAPSSNEAPDVWSGLGIRPRE
jgi:hypothetical protein